MHLRWKGFMGRGGGETRADTQMTAAVIQPWRQVVTDGYRTAERKQAIVRDLSRLAEIRALTFDFKMMCPGCRRFVRLRVHPAPLYAAPAVRHTVICTACDLQGDVGMGGTSGVGWAWGAGGVKCCESIPIRGPAADGLARLGMGLRITGSTEYLLTYSILQTACSTILWFPEITELSCFSPGVRGL